MSERARPLVVLLCVSRTWTDWARVRDWLSRFPPGSRVVARDERRELLSLTADAALTLIAESVSATWKELLALHRPSAVLVFGSATGGDLLGPVAELVLPANKAGIRVTIVPPEAR